MMSEAPLSDAEAQIQAVLEDDGNRLVRSCEQRKYADQLSRTPGKFPPFLCLATKAEPLPQPIFDKEDDPR